jgi:amidohydrolase
MIGNPIPPESSSSNGLPAPGSTVWSKAVPSSSRTTSSNPSCTATEYRAHVAPEYPAGTVGVRYGKAYAASNPFDIVLRGRSSHGAEPHLGSDVIIAAGALVGAIQTLVSREISPLDSAVISIGSLHAGTARNIIADEARLSGIIRCFGPEMRRLLADRLTAMANAIAAAHDAEADVSIQWGYSGIINDDAMTALVQQSAEKLLGKPSVAVEPAPSLTTEDFGELLSRAPGSFWHVGVGLSGAENPPLHNPRFNPDESALKIAAALHAQIAWDYLNG